MIGKTGSHFQEEDNDHTDKINIHKIDAKFSIFQNEFEKQLNRLPDSIR